MKAAPCGLVCLALTAFAGAAYAIDDHLLLAQDAMGVASATLAAPAAHPRRSTVSISGPESSKWRISKRSVR
jgi:hypothetical protein